ncbi:MAG: M1 family aminopeptidase, partial [Gammaproteobacteria bacterium]
MRQFIQIKWCFLSLILIGRIAAAAAPIHHDLVVTLEPDSGYLETVDTITLPQAVGETTFSLHAALKLHIETPGAKIIDVKDGQTSVPIKQYLVKLPGQQTSLKIQYSGKIQHKLIDRSHDYSGWRESTAGIIADQGVFLSISSFWFPIFGNDQLTFSLSANLPAGWRAISQGKTTGNNRWSETAPQDDIYLVAGKYQVYKRPTSVAEVQVYLHQTDSALAASYLQATHDYLELFSKLFGPYPYSKFALVENFWESGYGMPSFTLRGPKVIRLPFILHSSYPHEILHNWWGNGVFVDYSKGNWSEGLTTYLADHLIKEQHGQGSEYRRDTLQSYADYVADNQDSALKDFIGHNGQTSQAIGYGKTMMFFHMLRLYLGDEIFLQGIRQFYRDNLFKPASFDQIQQALEQTSGKDLTAEFTQWTGRLGAPSLEISEPVSEAVADGFRLSFVLRQTQKEEPFLLHVPVYIQTANEKSAVSKMVTISERATTVTFSLNTRPLRIRVDPLFDLFRHLNPGEIPSSLAQLFSANDPMIILPSQAGREIRDAYSKLARSWKNRASSIKIVWDDSIHSIPDNRMVWLFGRENLLAPEFIKTTTGMPLSLQDGIISIDGTKLSTAENSFVLTSRRPMTIGWLHGHSLAAIQGLARKIPHYGKYSYLAFSGDAPNNILKGRWPTTSSGMTTVLDENVP